MIVLSLFDGISCGRIAFDRAGLIKHVEIMALVLGVTGIECINTGKNS